MNNPVLVRFVDEIEGVPIGGFKLMPQHEWEEFENRIIDKAFPYTFRIGRKERRYEFAGDYLSMFSVSNVTQTWAEKFKKEFMTGEFGFIFWLPVRDEEEDIII